MNWKQEAKNDLFKLRKQQQALQNIPEQLAALRDDGHPTPYNLPSTVVKACAGIVGGVMSGEINGLAFVQAVEQAGQVVGRTYAQDDRAEVARQRLLEAIKLNLVNRKEFSIEVLRGKFDFVECDWQFKLEKKRFCRELARILDL